ncbi:MAG: hypothetical protein K9H15_04630 [Bacteroidales bacterium]|nr:hypothetical protein [Bacteroidales bacterium]
MKKSLLAMLPALAIYLFISAYGTDSKYPGGSPAGYTGSPGDGKDCTVCHGGSAEFADNWISSDVPPTGYLPGENYEITVTVSGSGDKGFLVAPQDIDGNLLGTLIPGSDTKLVGSNAYVTQKSASNSNPRIWNFTWTAPEAGTGEVIFYGAFTVNKPVTILSNLSLQENMGVGIPRNNISKITVFPNPAHSFFSCEMFVNEPTDLALDLYSLSGGLIRKLATDKNFSGNFTESFIIGNDIPRGCYLLVLSTNSEKHLKRLLIR